MFELLKSVNDPKDLRALSRQDLHVLAQELREYLIQLVSRTGGHLSSNLGTVELTIALHYVFERPTTAWSGTWATRPTATRS
ncbi:MAG: hypothetical protein KatS3mg123_0931 [Burkholderiales bacterium]|nr:MAG: hypothetical protein KatS3mg123_0931 [Burkholderiales bacterium]